MDSKDPLQMPFVSPTASLLESFRGIVSTLIPFDLYNVFIYSLEGIKRSRFGVTLFEVVNYYSTSKGRFVCTLLVSVQVSGKTFGTKGAGNKTQSKPSCSGSMDRDDNEIKID